MLMPPMAAGKARVGAGLLRSGDAARRFGYLLLYIETPPPGIGQKTNI